MVTLGAVKEREYSLIEQDEYVLCLHSLEEATGQWGDRLIWKFLVAPKEDYTAYICLANGDEKLVWVFTDVDIILGSLGHELAQVLSGRQLGKDADPPDEDDLIGKRCLAYITHETPTRGKNAGKKREAVVAGSIKLFKGPAKKVAPNVKPAAATAPDDDDRALIVSQLRKRAERLVKLDDEAGKAALAAVAESDLDAAPLEDLQSLSDAIQAQVTAALDA